MKTIRLFCAIGAVFAWGCSGSGDPYSNGSVTGGAAGIGSGGTSGAGGDQGGAGGSQDAGPEDAAPQPFGCADWTRDTTFPAGMDQTGDMWASSASDFYVAAGGFDKGALPHFNGAAWSLMSLPSTTRRVNAVWGASADDVWIGGSKFEGSFPVGVLLRREDQGDVREVEVFDDSIHEVASIWGADADNVFALAMYALNKNVKDARIYRKDGGAWNEMALPDHEMPLVMSRIWGKAADDVYAVGTQYDADMQPMKGVMWRFDGKAWTNIATIPSDVTRLEGIGGATEIVVVGSYADGAVSRGVRLMSADLESWTRFDSASTEYDSEAWSPRLGAALVAGTASPKAPGAARLATFSLGLPSDEGPIDDIATVVTGIWPVPDSNEVWLAAYSDSGLAGIYKGVCQ